MASHLEEPHSARQLVEETAISKLRFSRRFRRMMGGVALAAGLWISTHSMIDFSADTYSQKVDASHMDENSFLALGAIGAASTAVAVERYKTNKKIDRLVAEYGKERGGDGFWTTSLIIDDSGDFQEREKIHGGTLNKDANSAIDWLVGSFKTASSGLAVVPGGELVKSFVSGDQYQNALRQGFVSGTALIVAGLLVAVAPHGAERNKLEAVQERLENIDNSLGFEGQ